MENWVKERHNHGQGLLEQETFLPVEEMQSNQRMGKALHQEWLRENLSSPWKAQKPEHKGGWATFDFRRIPQFPGAFLPSQYQLWEMRLTKEEAHNNYHPTSCSSRHWGELCRCKSRVWYRIIDTQTGACVWQTTGARTEGPATKQLGRAAGMLWEIERLKDELRGK